MLDLRPAAGSSSGDTAWHALEEQLTRQIDSKQQQLQAVKQKLIALSGRDATVDEQAAPAPALAPAPQPAAKPKHALGTRGLRTIVLNNRVVSAADREFEARSPINIVTHHKPDAALPLIPAPTPVSSQTQAPFDSISSSSAAAAAAASAAPDPTTQPFVPSFYKPSAPVTALGFSVQLNPNASTASSSSASVSASASSVAAPPLSSNLTVDTHSSAAPAMESESEIQTRHNLILQHLQRTAGASTHSHSHSKSHAHNPQVPHNSALKAGGGAGTGLIPLFRAYDSGFRGVVSVDEFKAGAQMCGVRMSAAQWHTFVSRFDPTGSGEINYLGLSPDTAALTSPQHSAGVGASASAAPQPLQSPTFQRALHRTRWAVLNDPTTTASAHGIGFTLTPQSVGDTQLLGNPTALARGYVCVRLSVFLV